MRLGFVFTNYNSSEATRTAVKSVLHTKPASPDPVVVVDNASTPGEVALLRQSESEFPNLHVIYRKENAGYFSGLNEGIKILREQHLDINVVIVGNNDLIFPEDFPSKIEMKSSLFEKYPVISPDIITPDGEHQNPHVISRVSSLRELIYDVYYSSFILAKLIIFVSNVTKTFTDRKDEMHHANAGTIWQGYGACYILGPLFFTNFDALWSPSFLMGEEFFLSRQLQEKGFSIWYEPSIKVTHQRNASVSKMPSRKMWEYARESHAIYRKYITVR